MAERERAHYFAHPALPATDLLDARYVHHSFGRHTHDSYVVAAVTEGVEEFSYGGSTVRVGQGSVALVNPDIVHTGHAGVPEGWSYQVLYPSVETVLEVAADLRPPGAGTPAFPSVVVEDPQLTRLVLRVHAAAAGDDALAASTAFRVLVARLLRSHAAPRAPLRPASAGSAAAARARELLLARLTDPPDLEQLAAAVGTRPFPLLRAFREEHGLPPHAWLTQQRVRAARKLLDRDLPPAEVAVSVGFVDQSHLTRHFRRIVGVPPGAYRRAMRPYALRTAQERTRTPRGLPGTLGA